MTRAARHAALLLLAGAPLRAAAAQPSAGGSPAADSGAAPAPPARRIVPRRTVELWGGISPGSTQWGPILGITPDIRLGIVAVRFARELGATSAERPHAWWWTADVIPLARITPPWESRGIGCGPTRRDICLVPRDPSVDVSLLGAGVTGFGVSPLGITSVRRLSRSHALTLGATGGTLWMPRRVPTSRGARLNFTATLEAGLRVASTPRGAFSVAYRHHHLSNAGTGEENPAVASHLLTIGWVWGRTGIVPAPRIP